VGEVHSATNTRVVRLRAREATWGCEQAIENRHGAGRQTMTFQHARRIRAAGLERRLGSIDEITSEGRDLAAHHALGQGATRLRELPREAPHRYHGPAETPLQQIAQGQEDTQALTQDGTRKL